MAASTAESTTGVQAPKPVILVHGTTKLEPDTYQLFIKVKVNKPTRIGAAAAETLTELTVVVKTETSSLRKSLFLHDDDNDNDGCQKVETLPFIIKSAGTVEFSLLKFVGDFPVVVRSIEFNPVENAAARPKFNPVENAAARP